MTTFKDREAAFEAAFVHDQDLLFRAKARRTRLMAEWVGHQLRKSGADLAAYRERMVGLATAEGDAALVDRLHRDLDDACRWVSREALQDRMAELLTVAVAAVKAD